MSYDVYRGGPPPPDFKDFNGPLCEDPDCYQHRPHFPREYGCRWSEVAVDNGDGTTTIFLKKPPGAPFDLDAVLRLA